MISDVITAVTSVVDALEKLGVPYYIGGSVASSTHGMIRSTVDADLIADLKLEHVAPLAEMLGKTYYLNVNTMTDAVKRRACFNLIHLATVRIRRSPQTYRYCSVLVTLTSRDRLNGQRGM